MQLVSEFKVNGRTVRAGDIVKISPSRPGKKDGFEGKVRGADLRDGTIISIEVTGAPRGRPPAARSVRPERVTTHTAPVQEKIKERTRG